MLPQDTTPKDVTLKRCSKCGQEKPATPEYYNRDKSMTGGLHPWCKECRAKQVHANYVANKERIKQYNRDYYATNRERYSEQKHARYMLNRGEERKKNHLRYVANKKEHANINRQARARKFGAEGTHTAADVQAQYDRQKGKCYYCGKSVEKDYDVDHVIPLARGGTNWPDNLVITCSSCNASKKNKLPHEWIRGGRLL